MDDESVRREYLKNYKKYHYSKTRKVITFPLLLDDYNAFKQRAEDIGISVNKMIKELALNYLENKPQDFQTKEQKALLQEYIRISRGIATNINQMAYSANIGEVVDIKILIGSLKRYEDEFKALLSKIM